LTALPAGGRRTSIARDDQHEREYAVHQRYKEHRLSAWTTPRPPRPFPGGGMGGGLFPLSLQHHECVRHSREGGVGSLLCTNHQMTAHCSTPLTARGVAANVLDCRSECSTTVVANVPRQSQRMFHDSRSECSTTVAANVLDSRSECSRHSPDSPDCWRPLTGHCPRKSQIRVTHSPAAVSGSLASIDQHHSLVTAM